MILELKDQVARLDESMHRLWKAEDTDDAEIQKKYWVCSICNKNTYNVEWDYIGTGTNHLGCELKKYNETKIKA